MWALFQELKEAEVANRVEKVKKLRRKGVIKIDLKGKIKDKPSDSDKQEDDEKEDKQKQVEAEEERKRLRHRVEIIRDLYKDPEVLEIYKTQNKRHLEEDEKMNGNYDKYIELKGKIKKAEIIFDSIVAKRFENREKRVGYYDATLLKEVEELIHNLKRELAELTREDPDLSALVKYEQLRIYNEEYRENNFIWTESRKESLQKIEEAAVSGKPVLVSGESGTGKTRLVEEVAVKLTGHPNTQTPGKDFRFSNIIARPMIGNVDGKSTSYFRYGSLGMAVAGKDSTLPNAKRNDGYIVADDEANLRPAEDLTEMMARIASWRSGLKIRMPVTDEEVTIPPKFLYCAMVNLASKRYKRTDFPPEVKRKFAKVDVDYFPQSNQHPEIYEVLLSALIDQNGRIQCPKSEISPDYEFKEQEETITRNGQQRKVKVRTRELKDFEEEISAGPGPKKRAFSPAGGFLWRFSNFLNQINLSFSGKETVFKHKGDDQYFKDLIIDIGTALGWMREYSDSKLNQSLESYIVGKLKREFIETEVYNEEDKALLKEFLAYFKIDLDADSSSKPAPEFQIMSPRDIGLLSPAVAYREVIEEEIVIKKGKTVDSDGMPIDYNIESIEIDGVRIEPGEMFFIGENTYQKFLGVSDTGEPIFVSVDEIELRAKQKRSREATEDTVLNVPETIENTDINIEKSIEKHIEFYTRYSIPIPPNFREQIIDIWNRNYTEIQKEIKEKGFDELLIMPANLTMTPELDEKMTAGYVKEDGKPGDPTKWNINIDKIKPAVLDRLIKPRILLVHKNNSQNIYKNPSAPLILKDTLSKKFTAFKPEEGLTIEEYFVFQRMYFEETGKHLDEIGWTWIRCSTNEDSSRVVWVYWDPDLGGLDVFAYVSSSSSERLGCRLSRSFD